MIHNDFTDKTFKAFSQMSSKDPKRTRDIYCKLKKNNEMMKRSFLEELEIAMKGKE